MRQMRRAAGSVVTLYDVASLAGVSTATVSRVVHSQDRVRDSTRARVLAVIEQLGYVPDGAAQSLSRRRKDVIGLVCVERKSPKLQYDIESMSLLFYDEILRGVEARIRHHNWSLLITYLEGAADVVTADNRSGSAGLVTHLIEDHGRRRLYYVDGPPSAPDARERRLALMHVLRGAPDCRLVGSSQGMFTVASGVEAGQALLALGDGQLPDAVVCANDQMAIGVLQALAGAGVSVPGQVAVVGFDDIFPGSLCDPPLTTVHQPMRLLGERACTRLLDRIAKPSLRQKVELLPTELVLRSSCGCPPGTMTRQPVTRLRSRPGPRTALAPLAARHLASAETS